MSIETLNLLSDSTFGTKIDEQNGILEDIRDSLGGGLDTSALVYGGTPDADSVVQLKKKDPVSGNDVNVYPALAPDSSLGRYLFPALPSEIDWTNWNSPECIAFFGSLFTQDQVITPNIYKKSFILNDNRSISIAIKRSLLDPQNNLTEKEAICNMIILINNSAYGYSRNILSNLSYIDINNTTYVVGGFEPGRNYPLTFII